MGHEVKAPAACSLNALRPTWSPHNSLCRQPTMMHKRSTTSSKTDSLCSVAHLQLCMSFPAPSRCCVFNSYFKVKGRASGLKVGSSWLQTAQIEVDALWRCLRRAVYPSNVQPATGTPSARSAPPGRRQLPLGEKHLRGKEKRKSQSLLSKGLQVFSEINWRHLDLCINNRMTF